MIAMYIMNLNKKIRFHDLFVWLVAMCVVYWSV